jgi:hypothetical protein
MGDIYRSTSSVPLTPRRQFTLAGMLSFVLAVGVYCSMLTSLRPLVSRDYLEYDPGPTWPIFTTVPTAWCVLWWLYRRWRLPQALRVHYAAPVVALGLIAAGLCAGVCVELVSLAHWPPGSDLTIDRDVGNALSTAIVAMIYACGVSTLVSLPAATIMLVYLMLPPASSQQTRQAQAINESQSHE